MRRTVRGTSKVWLTVLLFSLPGSFTKAQTPADDLRVARLVRQLGAAEADARQSAQKALLELGGGSRARLQQALANDDPEVRLRARALLDECLTEDLWSASQVELPAESRLATSVLASIVAQTGNRLLVGDQYGAFNEVAFDGAGQRMPFWQAVDELCGGTANHLRPHYDVRAGGLVACGARRASRLAPTPARCERKSPVRGACSSKSWTMPRPIPTSRTRFSSVCK